MHRAESMGKDTNAIGEVHKPGNPLTEEIAKRAPIESHDKEYPKEPTHENKSSDELEEISLKIAPHTDTTTNKVVESEKKKVNGEGFDQTAVDADTKKAKFEAKHGESFREPAHKPIKVENENEGKDNKTEETKHEDGQHSKEVNKEVSSENEAKVGEKLEEEDETHKQPLNFMAKVKHSFTRVKNVLIRPPTRQKPHEDHKPSH